MPVPGPFELGRGVIVAGDGAVPLPFVGFDEVAVREIDLAEPGPVVERLHAMWLERRPVVIRLRVDAARFRDPVSTNVEPWRLDVTHELWLDRLHFLVWANTYDARAGDPIWWWGRKAVRLGATETIRGPGDVELSDGTAAVVDGGPRASAPFLDDLAVIPSEHVTARSLAPVPVPGTIEAELLADQLAAVVHPSGPVRVIAPAGSGKTRVLTERLRHLLHDRGYDRSTVLAVAFNKKAQEQLAERLADLRPRTQTLNALGYAIVAEHRGRRPEVLDERAVRGLIEAAFPIPRRRTNTDPVAPYLEALTAVRLGLRDPTEVEDERDDVPGFAAGFDDYRRRLTEGAALDFDEQVYAAIEALLSDGPFRRRVQFGHQHLLVDEFQDLTPAHVLLIRLLATPGLDVFGVGDDDQTIYDHAGADPRFLIDFAKFFPGAAATALTVNHRCPAVVVRAADRVLRRNRIRVEKEVQAAESADPDPKAMRIVVHPSDGGSRALVDVVRGWIETGAAPTDIAVLTRVNSLLLAPHVALVNAGIPVASTLGPEVLERTGVAAALAWLRIAVDPGAVDPRDLEVVARRPSRGFPQWIGKWFAHCRSVHELTRIAERIDDDRVADKIADLAADLTIVAKRAEGTTRAVLEAVRDDIDLGGAMQLLDGSKGGQAASSHLDDLDALLQVADLHPDPAGFETFLRGTLRNTRDPDGVTLATIHRVKGREWDHVALFGVVEGVMPHRLAESREAERRVFHVGITRACKQLAVLADASRPSRFVHELTSDRATDPPEPAPSPVAGERSQPARRSAVIEGPALPGAEQAEAALRRWRTERARADAVPPFVILSDAHLIGIARRMPATAEALRRCPGIGPAKLERYGDEILALVADAGGG